MFTRGYVTEEYMASVNTLAATDEEIQAAGVAKYGSMFPQGSGIRVREVQERFLPKQAPKAKAYLDFDTGKQFYLLEDYTEKRGRYDFSIWRNQKGIDVQTVQFVSRDGRVAYELQGFDTYVWQAPNDVWDSFEKHLNAGTIQLDSSGPGRNFYPRKKGERLPDWNRIPATFLFTTAGGSAGILQIVGFSDQPPGVRIRYRLVNSTSP